jgi:hypothetical protein
LSLAAAAAGATADTAAGAEAASPPPAPAAGAAAATTVQRPRYGGEAPAGQSDTRGAAAQPGRRAGPAAAGDGDGRRWWEEATDMPAVGRAKVAGVAGASGTWAGTRAGLARWPEVD